MSWLDAQAGLLLARGLAVTLLLTAVTSLSIDMSVASMNHTRERDNTIDFSITYFRDNQSFLIRKGIYTRIEELMGKTVAANAGSSAIPSWQAYAVERGGPAPDIVAFDDKLAAMQALRDGAVEGYTEDIGPIDLPASHLPDGPVLLAIRPEAIAIDTHMPDKQDAQQVIANNRFLAYVETSDIRVPAARCRIAVNGQSLSLRPPPYYDLHAGQKLTIQLPRERICVLPPEDTI